MMSHDDALELFEREKVAPNVVRHSLLVNRIANYIAEELVDIGVNVDLELVDIGSLLNDVGRGRDHKNHSAIGVEILKELGEEDVSRIIGVHGVKCFDESMSIEEKIVNYADKRVRHDELVSFDDRMEDIVERYPHAAEVVKDVFPKYKEFESEVFGIIGMDKVGLERLKRWFC